MKETDAESLDKTGNMFKFAVLEWGMNTSFEYILNKQEGRVVVRL